MIIMDIIIFIDVVNITTNKFIVINKKGLQWLIRKVFTVHGNNRYNNSPFNKSKNR